MQNHVKEIIMMGGSTGRGNVTPLAEFNIYCDPEAAHIVFNAGLPLTMIGLDLARQSLFTHSYLDTLKDKTTQHKCCIIFSNTIAVKFLKKE